MHPTHKLSEICVLQVIPALDSGGAERTTLEVARGIVAAGGRSIVASQGGRMVASLVAEGSEHIHLPMAAKSPLGMRRNRAALEALIAERGVDIVHARSRAPAWPALWAARATGAAFVTTYHGAYSGRSAPKKLYNSVMARGDVVIANSRFTRMAIEEAFGRWRFLRGREIVTIPRGADLSDFGPAALCGERREAAFGAFGGRGAVRILLPGRMTPWKGQRVLIEAARRLQMRDGLPPLHFALIGDAQGRGSYVEELKQMIAAEDIGRTVRLHGHWNDMPAAYDWSDIAVSASTRPEAFGRVAVEAMASARPVVASAHGGSLESVVDRETGRLVPPDDPGALADALGDLAGDAAMRTRMGAAGAVRARKLFSTDAMVAATLAVYEKVLAKRQEAPA